MEEQVMRLDLRGLEPPQPMVRILEALPGLAEQSLACVEARTDRRPMHLYAQLAKRGFSAESTEEADGSVITRIRRA